jgi:hypothetical protein
VAERHTFLHEAVVAMAADADERAPGAAITIELCGHWEHQPPCPLAEHHTEATRKGEEIHLRVEFATDPELEAEVRSRIDTALARSELRTSHGTTHWGPVPL